LTVTIDVESPLTDEVRTLIAELNTVLLALSPPEACYNLTVEEMADPTVTVWIARDGDAAIGCGALKRHSDTVGEVKRMFTRPAWQGKGVGRHVLDKILETAEREELETLVLETGDQHPAAWAIYEKAGLPAAAPCSTTRIHPIPYSIKSSFVLPDLK